MEWERGETPPGRVMSNLKTGGLREILESSLGDLRYEINNTDSHDFKVKLREKQAVLERMIAAL